MSLIHSANLNGHDPYAYIRDVLTRLPTQPASRIEDASAALLAAQLNTELAVKAGWPDVYAVAG